MTSTSSTSREDELQTLFAETYQVVGSLLSDLGKFDTPEGQKILDNLSQQRLVHTDILPWPSYEKSSDASLTVDTSKLPRLYEITGDIKDVNTILINVNNLRGMGHAT